MRQRSQWWAWLLRLLLLLLSAGCHCCCQASELNCDWPRYGSPDLGPSPPPLSPVLPWLDNAAFNLTVCSWSFAQFEQSWRKALACFSYPRFNVHTCPQHCVQAMRLDPVQARLYGSFPYHANSSICLAAIHAGVISSERGGGLFIDRFFPADWSGSSTQTVFPHRSWAESLSNGAQSEAVPSGWHSVPSPLLAYSWTVRARGVVASQRQTAPFSPRAGHLVLSLTHVSSGSFTLPSWHLVIGGMNATHYMNDVFLYASFILWDGINSFSTTNGRFWQLDAAPLSPRAFMAASSHALLEGCGRYNVLNGSTCSPSGRTVYSFIIVGGQSGQACGDPLLGRCETDVWTLTMTPFTASPEHGWRADWRLHTAAAPIPARCGSSVIQQGGPKTYEMDRIIGVVGGQLSFDGDDSAASCSNASRLIGSSNAAYYSTADNLARWRRGVDAPFSPRRSMQVDDSFLLGNSGVLLGQPDTALLVDFDKSVSLTGGIRYLERQWSPSTNVSRMTRAEVFADVWSCTLVTPEYDSSPIDCDWHQSQPIADTRRGGPYAPTGSLPVPIAHAANHPMRASTRWPWNARFGGASSRQALDSWQRQPPPGLSLSSALQPSDLPANVSFIMQPVVVDGDTASATTVSATRYSLPLSYELSEDEAADSFTTGTAAVLTLVYPLGRGRVQTLITTLHSQESQMVQTAEESSWHVYQAASSLNTTRRHFDVSNRRVGHSALSTGLGDALIISGGRSEGRYTNDWITHQQQSCHLPTDPSYSDLLGPGTAPHWRVSSQQQPSIIQVLGPYAGQTAVAYPWQAPRYLPGTSVDFWCDTGFHFSPPQMSARAVLTCMGNGLWMDAELGSVRRCVPNRLACAWPFVDLGFGSCSEPEPRLLSSSLQAVPAPFEAAVQQPHNDDAATMADVPSVGSFVFTRNLQLVLTGQWLRPPIRITAGEECWQPQLRNVTRWCAVDGQQNSCRLYGTEVTCTVEFYRTEEPMHVRLEVGEPSRSLTAITVRSRQDEPPFAVWDHPITLSRAPPTVYSISASACSRPSLQADSLLRLVNCSISAPFEMEVCLQLPKLSLWLGSQEISLASAASPLQCGEWSPTFFQSSSCATQAPELTLACRVALYCSRCLVLPTLGEGLTLRASTDLGNGSRYRLDNSEQLSSSSPPSLSFSRCAQGTASNITAWGAFVNCRPCEAGRSTNGLDGQAACTPCAPGYHAAVPGLSQCRPCSNGSYTASYGATECSPCPPNSWQLQTGQSECIPCDAGKYLRWVAEDAATCEDCPIGALCSANGTISARAGFYLIVSQDDTVQSVACSELACVGLTGSTATGAQSSLSLRTASGITVVNSCGANREPAVELSGSASAVTVPPLNVLCARCLPGYMELLGVCRQCESVRWRSVLGVALLVFVLVYLLHRCMNDGDESALIPIVVYFLQMTAVFFSDELMPQLASIVNLDVVGQMVTGTSCVVPLTDYGKLITRLLSPFLALLCLGLLLVVQLAINAWVTTRPWATQLLRQASVDDAAAVATAHTAVPQWYKVYCLLLPAAEQSPAAAAASALSRPRPRQAASAGWSEVSSQASPSSSVQRERGLASLRVQLLDESDPEEKQAAFASPPEQLMDSDASVQAEAASGADAVRSESQLALQSFAGVSLYYRRSVLRLALFSYNTLTISCLAFFGWQSVGDLGDRLQVYPSIDPSEPQYRLYLPVVILCALLLVGGIPVGLLLYQAWLHRRGLLVKEQNQAGQQNERPAAGAGLARMFKSSYWYYSVVVLVRRLLLIVVLTFSPLLSVYSIVNSINWALVVGHCVLWPYKRDRDNWRELLTLAALSLQTAILSTYPIAVGRPVAATVLLWLLCTVPTAAIPVQALVSSCRRSSSVERQRMLLMCGQLGLGLPAQLLLDWSVSVMERCLSA